VGLFKRHEESARVSPAAVRARATAWRASPPARLAVAAGLMRVQRWQAAFDTLRQVSGSDP
jgi:hypothetical protein